MRTIYLDYCTSTPVAASVRDSMLPFLSDFYGHPSSSHWFGRAAQEAIEDARSNLAGLLGCHPSEVIFTSGGTESVNLGLLGLARAIGKNLGEFKPHLITTDLEHTCVRKCAEHLNSIGWDVSYVGCDSSGIVKLDELESLIRPHTRIVSVIHASHRIGTIQPIDRVASICQQRDILLHTDASQTIGKVDFDVDQLSVDMLSLSGHKFYAPKGIGALYVRLGVPVEPILFGDGCETGLRPGTPSVSHIVGLGQAAKLASAGLESTISETTKMRERFLNLLQEMVKRPITVHGIDAPRLPNILSFELPGVRAVAVQQMLPEICFGPNTISGNGRSKGKTCNTTHAALGLTEAQSANTLQVSFGWTTTEQEIQQAARMIATAYDSLCD